MKQLYLHIKLAALSMLLFSACTQDEIMNQANVEKCRKAYNGWNIEYRQCQSG